MQSAQSTVAQPEESIRVEIAREINERTTFQTIDLRLAKTLELDAHNVEYMNSAGISAMAKWFSAMRTTQPDLRIVLNNVPYQLLYQIATVDGLLPAGSRVRTIGLPYFCETCNSTEIKKFRLGLDLALQSSECLRQLFAESNCTTCGSTLEIDAHPHVCAKAIQSYGGE